MNQNIDSRLATTKDFIADEQKIQQEKETLSILDGIKADIKSFPKEVNITDNYPRLQDTKYRVLNNFLEKYSDKGSVLYLIPKYVQMIGQSSKLSHSGKITEIMKVKELVAEMKKEFVEEIVVDEKLLKTEKTKNSNDKLGNYIRARLGNIDRSGDSKERFMQYLFKGLESVDKNPASSTVKYYFAKKNGTFQSLEEFYARYKQKLILENKGNEITNLNNLFLEYLQNTNQKLEITNSPKNTQEKLINTINGTVRDFQNVYYDKLQNMEGLRKSVTSNLLAISKTDALLAGVYKKYSDVLINKSAMKELITLNNLMNDYIDRTKTREIVVEDLDSGIESIDGGNSEQIEKQKLYGVLDELNYKLTQLDNQKNIILENYLAGKIVNNEQARQYSTVLNNKKEIEDNINITNNKILKLDKVVPVSRELENIDLTNEEQIKEVLPWKTEADTYNSLFAYKDEDLGVDFEDLDSILGNY